MEIVLTYSTSSQTRGYILFNQCGSRSRDWWTLNSMDTVGKILHTHTL